MSTNLVTNIKIDPRVLSYSTFFNHTWARRISELTAGTKLYEPVFALCVNWKSVANTHVMPWLMVENLRGFWKGCQNGQESGSEVAVAHLARHVPAAMGDSLSHMNRKKLAQVMAEIGGQIKDFREQYTEEIDPQALFDSFLDSPGGSELQLSIWGSQRTTYGALFHAYENYLTRCIAIARNEPDYRPFKFKTLHTDARASFGEAVAEYCLTDPLVDAARLVRNALSHHGGKVTDELKVVPHGVDVVGEVLQIMPDDNRQLFDVLKDRAIKLAEAASTLPHLG